MALTTKTSESISQNVVSDPNANTFIPSNQKRALSPDAAILFDRSIVARPLMVPDVCSLHIKNTDYRYRWVNRLSQGGRFYMQRKSQGFINATPADVQVLGGDAAQDKGEITAGDLILMKIRSDIYDAAMKWNMQKADALTRARGMYLDGASSDVNSDVTAKRVSVANEAFNKNGNAQSFIPDNPDALVDDSIKSGRVNATRKVTDELRANGAQEK
jgi:hypothetical protein